MANIKQYITSDPKKAEHLLTDYTFFLRQSLPSTQTTKGTIANELTLINAYIAVQQTRFPYIRFIEKTDEKLKDISLPPLLIQPLIENAIAHGLAPQGHQGLITLTIKQTLEKLIIEVADSGVGFAEVSAEVHAEVSVEEKPEQESIALKNIQARLTLHHPLATLNVLVPDQGATVQIVIPLNKY